MKNKKSKPPRVDLLNCPIGKTIIKMSIPMGYGLLAIMLFNTIDTIFIGKLGTEPLAAMGFSFPIIFILMSLSFGLATGTTAVISRYIGTGDKKYVKMLTKSALLLSFLIVAVVAGIGLVTITPTFALLGASPEMIELISQYMVIWYAGLAFLVVPMVGNAAIRATGDTKTPSIIMVVAGLANAILDPFLIFGIGPFPRLELQGAAIATALSYVITFVCALWFLYFREQMIDCKPIAFKDMFVCWKVIMRISIPSAFAGMLVPVAAAVVTRILSSFGEEAVAAYGVATRVESLALVGLFALSVSIVPFIGQNFGAKKFDRVLQSYGITSKYSMLWGLGTVVILGLFAKPIALLFNNDPTVVHYVTLFLWIVPISYGLMGVTLVAASALNAINKPLLSSLTTIVRLGVFFVPLSFFGAHFFGVLGIIAGISLANIFSGITIYFWTRRELR